MGGKWKERENREGHAEGPLLWILDTPLEGVLFGVRVPRHPFIKRQL